MIQTVSLWPYQKAYVDIKSSGYAEPFAATVYFAGEAEEIGKFAELPDVLSAAYEALKRINARVPEYKKVEIR